MIDYVAAVPRLRLIIKAAGTPRINKVGRAILTELLDSQYLQPAQAGTALGSCVLALDGTPISVTDLQSVFDLFNRFIKMDIQAAVAESREPDGDFENPAFKAALIRSMAVLSDVELVEGVGHLGLEELVPILGPVRGARVAKLAAAQLSTAAEPENNKAEMKDNPMDGDIEMAEAGTDAVPSPAQLPAKRTCISTQKTTPKTTPKTIQKTTPKTIQKTTRKTTQKSPAPTVTPRRSRRLMAAPTPSSALAQIALAVAAPVAVAPRALPAAVNNSALVPPPVAPAMGNPALPDNATIVPAGYLFPRGQITGPCPLGVVDTGFLVYFFIHRQSRVLIVKYFKDLGANFRNPAENKRLNAWRRAVVRASPTGPEVIDGATYIFPEHRNAPQSRRRAAGDNLAQFALAAGQIDVSAKKDDPDSRMFFFVVRHKTTGVHELRVSAQVEPPAEGSCHG